MRGLGAVRSGKAPADARSWRCRGAVRSAVLRLLQALETGNRDVEFRFSEVCKGAVKEDIEASGLFLGVSSLRALQRL